MTGGSIVGRIRPLILFRKWVAWYLVHIGYHYIRQRSWANVMYSPLFVCLSVCYFAKV